MLIYNHLKIKIFYIFKTNLLFKLEFKVYFNKILLKNKKILFHKKKYKIIYQIKIKSIIQSKTILIQKKYKKYVQQFQHFDLMYGKIK